MQHTTLIATLQKVRYLTRHGGHIEIQYTVEGSDKIYRHTLTRSGFLDGSRDEIAQLYKRFSPWFKSLGDGCRAKIIYDRHDYKSDLKFEISYNVKDNKRVIFLSCIN